MTRSDHDVRRQAWAKARQEVENTVLEVPGRKVFHLFLKTAHRMLLGGLWLSGLLARGLRNGRSPLLRTQALHLPSLPPAFHGYRILHLSDLHLPVVPQAMAQILVQLRRTPLDLVVMTGDIGYWLRPLSSDAFSLLAALRQQLAPADGFLVVPGNHDLAADLLRLEALGYTLLINESFDLVRGEEKIRLTGCDDVHFFYTPQVEAVLREPLEGFGIALVHSPEAATLAAQGGYHLYLTGHTHGGQVRLPGLPPLLTALRSHKSLAQGVWRWQGMVGVTSNGVGASSPAVRFHCPGEAVVLVLHRDL